MIDSHILLPGLTINSKPYNLVICVVVCIGIMLG